MAENVINPCIELVRDAGYRFAYNQTSKLIVLMRDGVRVRGGLKMKLFPGKGAEADDVGRAITEFLNSAPCH